MIRTYGEVGCSAVTKRQKWWFCGVVLPHVPEILKGLGPLGFVGLTSPYRFQKSCCESFFWVNIL